MRIRRSLIALFCSGCAAAAAAIGAGAAPWPPARMLVYAQEWSLWPSRSSLPAGRVTIQLWNRGQDAHNLRIRHLDAAGAMTGSTQGVRVTQSGALHQATWHLAPGRYELYCSMPGHRARGMHVKLVVR
jgi:plastocyanin